MERDKTSRSHPDRPGSRFKQRWLDNPQQERAYIRAKGSLSIAATNPKEVAFFESENTREKIAQMSDRNFPYVSVEPHRDVQGGSVTHANFELPSVEVADETEKLLLAAGFKPNN